MPLRSGVILSALVAASLPAGAAAQSTASAVVQATVRPGNCPVHARCGDNPGKGPKVKEGQTDGTTPATVPVENPPATLDVSAPAGVQPLRVVVRAPNAQRADEMGVAVGRTTSRGAERRLPRTSAGPGAELLLELSDAVVQEMGPSGLWLYGLLRSTPRPHGAYRGLITVVVEY